MKNFWDEHAEQNKTVEENKLHFNVVTKSGHTINMTDEPSIKITGNIPEAFKKALAAIKTDTPSPIIKFDKPQSIWGNQSSTRCTNCKGEVKPIDNGCDICGKGYVPGPAPIEKFPMGTGDNPMFSSDFTFVKENRFLINVAGSPSLMNFIKAFEADYHEKVLEIETYETIDGVCHDFILGGYRGTSLITQTVLDGCGNVLFNIEFSALRLCGHKIKYDYAKGGVPVHHMKITFEFMKRIPNSATPSPIIQFDKPQKIWGNQLSNENNDVWPKLDNPYVAKSDIKLTSI